MPRGKDLTMTELNEIRSFLNDGCSYTEIAELMGRTKKSIEIAVWRYGLKNGKAKVETKRAKKDEDKSSLFNEVIEQMNENAKFTSDVTTDEPRESATVKQIVEQTKPEPQVIYKEKIVYKDKTLDDFTARDMIRHLYKLGYRIDGTLYCLVKQSVNVKDIING